jgi:hypothetical protein
LGPGLASSVRSLLILLSSISLVTMRRCSSAISLWLSSLGCRASSGGGVGVRGIRSIACKDSYSLALTDNSQTSRKRTMRAIVENECADIWFLFNKTCVIDCHRVWNRCSKPDDSSVMQMLRIRATHEILW